MWGEGRRSKGSRRNKSMIRQRHCCASRMAPTRHDATTYDSGETENYPRNLSENHGNLSRGIYRCFLFYNPAESDVSL